MFILFIRLCAEFFKSLYAIRKVHDQFYGLRIRDDKTAKPQKGKKRKKRKK